MLAAAEAISTYWDRKSEWETGPWIRPVTEFGLAIRPQPATALRITGHNFDNDLPVVVPVSLIRSSVQLAGIRLDALAHYLLHPLNDLFDRDGWYGNRYPLVVANDDGTYTILDGNHRCIGARMKGIETILVNVA